MTTSISHKYAAYVAEYIAQQDEKIMTSVMTGAHAPVSRISVYSLEQVHQLSYKLGKQGVPEQQMEKHLKKKLVPLFTLKIKQNNVEMPPAMASQYKMHSFEEWIVEKLDDEVKSIRDGVS